MIAWTDTLRTLTASNLRGRARAAVAKMPADLLARTAAFLSLKDSKSSFAIENEHPPHDRIRRWGRAIGEAGRCPIDLEELLRLQRIVIGDARFVHLGLRYEGALLASTTETRECPCLIISARVLPMRRADYRRRSPGRNRLPTGL